jgi:hypothetical protein
MSRPKLRKGKLREALPGVPMIVFDSESIDSAGDYEDVAKDILELTFGELSLDGMESGFEEGKGFHLILKAGGRTFRGDLRDSEYIDARSLAELLGRAAEEQRLGQRFFTVYGHDWGQEIGVVFVKPERCIDLEEQGFVINA